jgi:hypothetical protein
MFVGRCGNTDDRQKFRPKASRKEMKTEEFTYRDVTNVEHEMYSETCNCKRDILKDPNFASGICRKLREKSQTVRHRASRCMSCNSSRRLSSLHSAVANIVQRELAIKCGLSNGPPTPDYKYEP